MLLDGQTLNYLQYEIFNAVIVRLLPVPILSNSQLHASRRNPDADFACLVFRPVTLDFHILAFVFRHVYKSPCSHLGQIVNHALLVKHRLW